MVHIGKKTTQTIAEIPKDHFDKETCDFLKGQFDEKENKCIIVAVSDEKDPTSLRLISPKFKPLDGRE